MEARGEGGVVRESESVQVTKKELDAFFKLLAEVQFVDVGEFARFSAEEEEAFENLRAKLAWARDCVET